MLVKCSSLCVSTLDSAASSCALLRPSCTLTLMGWPGVVCSHADQIKRPMHERMHIDRMRAHARAGMQAGICKSA